MSDCADLVDYHFGGILRRRLGINKQKKLCEERIEGPIPRDLSEVGGEKFRSGLEAFRSGVRLR